VRHAFSVLGAVDVPGAVRWLRERGVDVDKSYAYQIARKMGEPHLQVVNGATVGSREDAPPTEPTPNPLRSSPASGDKANYPLRRSSRRQDPDRLGSTPRVANVVSESIRFSASAEC